MQLVFSPETWQKNINQLISIHSNMRYPKNMAIDVYFWENSSIQQDLMVWPWKFCDNFGADNYSASDTKFHINSCDTVL